MKVEAALKFYKKQSAIAKALGVKRQQVSLWKKVGLIPAKHAIRLQRLTKARVKVDAKLYVPKGQ